MKVLFVYKFLDLGGVEAVLAVRLQELPTLGIDAEAWFLRDGPGRQLFRRTPQQIHVGGVYELQRYLEWSNPDVVSTIDTEEAFRALQGATRDQAVVIEVHTPYRENRVYLGALDRVRVRAFLTPTGYQASLIAGQTRRIAPTHVVPNSLHPMFGEELRSLRNKTEAPLIGWVGRLDGLKNWREYLETGRILLRLGHGVELWVVGKSEEEGVEARLMADAKRKGVLGSLRWYRGLPHERMPRLFDAIRESGGVVLSTSTEESFGLSVAEAMARGCAIVAPRRSVFPEFIEDGEHGRLYRPRSADDAASCIASLLQDQALRERCGARARKDILDRHSPGVALPILAETLRRLVSEP